MTYPIKPIARAALAAAGGLALASCVPADGPAATGEDALLESLDTSLACFNQRDIRGYAAAPGGRGAAERIILRTGARERFLLESMGVCPNLDFSLRIALDMRVGSRSCTGDVETLLVPGSIPSELDRCPVRVLGRLPAE